MSARPRMPAEWAPHERTIVCWPARETMWQERFGDAKAEHAAVVNAIAAFEPVTLAVYPAQEAEALDGAPFGLLGDFNVAPTDADVWDPALLAGGTHVSAPERAALEDLRTGVGPDGLADLLPRASYAADDVRHPWTFWEMRMLGFQKGRGMRLDLALVNPALVARVTDVWVDRDARRGQGPSDHAPLVLDLAHD